MLICMDDAAAAERVESALDDLRIDRGWQWDEVAERAGISVPTLSRFRKGQRTRETTRKVELAFGLERGYIDAVAAGETPPATRVTVNERPASLEEMRVLADNLAAQAAALRKMIDDMERGGGEQRSTG